jgi:hypothetical protein
MIIRPVRIEEDGTVTELDWKSERDKRYIKQTAGLYVFRRLQEHLADRDIYFSRPGEPFEFSIASYLSCFHKRLRCWHEGPLIVHDHHDTAGLTQVCRSCLRSKKVLGIIKPRLFRHYEDHNEPVLSFPAAAQTLHTTKIADALPPWFTTEGMPRPVPGPHIPRELIARKIRLVPGYSHAQMFQTGWAEGPQLDQPRPYDCYFAGTTAYDNWPVVIHRVSCYNAMRECRSRGAKCAHVAKLWNWKEYMQEGIRRTKVAPSPWGYGAVCFRDFEVLMGGAILVKPDTEFCRGWPDLFHPDNDLYVKCRFDHADLPDIVDDVRSHWNWDRYRSMRERGWEFVEKYHNPDLTADHLAEVFHYFESLA